MEWGDKMLEIVMVRHGKTLFNEKDRVQGWCDSPLTKMGKKQAQNVGRHLADIPFTLAFSSPSERASDTCEAIIGDKLPIQLDKRLKEFNFGYLEGDMNASLLKPGISDFEEFVKIGWVEEGGENGAMVMERITSFFEELITKYQEETILLVSHGMWLDYALKYIMKENYVSHQIQNCSVTKVRYQDGKWQIIEIGNTGYRED